MSTSLRVSNPVPFNRVTVNDSFWKPRMDVNRNVTLAIEYEQCKNTGRFDAFKWSPGQPNEPHIFWDSDTAKWIEAAAYSLSTHPDPELEKKVDGLVDELGAAQQPDGYLNSRFQRVDPGKRWTNLRDCHELYCAGHLMEAATAYFQATGKRKLLDIMSRYADHIDSMFGREEGKRKGYCGHPEVELALVKLYRATGNERYLKLSEYFVNERGQAPNYFDWESTQLRGEPAAKPWYGDHSYQQADKPLREQTEVRGHAVRAMYIFSAMADVAAETGDQTLIDACKRLWENVTLKRMHVTGGLGPTHKCEGFSFDYDMPNEDSYLETCAAIALVFWAHRMLHMEADGRYADVMEKALYNGVLSGISLDGKSFFYANPLGALRGVNPQGWGTEPGKLYLHQRSEWFGCACCPPNVARLLASFGDYIYSTGAAELRVNLYVGSSTSVQIAGKTVGIEQKTQHPWSGTVDLTLTPETATAFSLNLRIPGWCRKFKATVNGKKITLKPRKGYAAIRRTWKAGDRVKLVLDMPVELIEAHPRVRQDVGRVALQCGPVIYCVEEADNGANVFDIVIPRKSKFTMKFNPKLLGGVGVITGKALRHDEAQWKGTLYRPAGASRMKPITVKAIPYSCWTNRQPGEMAVWLCGQ